ncbi:uncharacterized protein LOC110106281 isoform X2 [Dendrobium catenatum]|uniref:C2H2-type domain-containing protein n=2 Tax=Dendrobium catenatum TaxID=906689 RepID=A0A2I0W9I8_9ASPA|nr:uncharacterized protein LOC110106281 isoform X2 [Dendrobium catenatum]XP_020691780.1 uncharacterized protein LOC110106281 isoform X2 [Dendrobium catenatum]PKU72311.1 hypothetical protein MA16_Dca006311 [Dendrobium catenatum]
MNTEAGDAVEAHGMAVDKDKSRVQCNYCGKEVRGFNRLKHHLGGVGHDVTACIGAPDDVKARMKGLLLEKKKERLLKEVGEIYHPDLPLKRHISPTLSDPKRVQSKLTHLLPTSSDGEGSTEMRNGENQNVVDHAGPSQPASLDKGKNVMECPPFESGSVYGGIHILNKMEDADVIVKEEVKDDSFSHVAKLIGCFFIEAGIDPNVIKLSSFQKMIDASISCGFGFRVPRHDELKGWILDEQLKEVCRHVENVRSSWERTGCSILLDGWTDQQGRSLIRFLVDSPQGTIFLRSVDASDAISNADALFLLFSKVVEEVGAQNVVQVIAHEKSCYMEAAGKKLVEKYRSLFWTVCADYCINLILEKIGVLDHVKKVLFDAKAITRFIYSHLLPFELMRKHIQGSYLVRQSKLKSISDFLTLGNILSERENLIQMFRSEAWSSSELASKPLGKKICELVNDPFFWAASADVTRVTNPIIRVLQKIDGCDTAPMGFLYDAMDRAKEGIKGNLGGEEARYLPLWSIIDEIWDNYLHCPLHSAGYYLNPNLFCSNDFFVDTEVTNGLLGCIVRMVEGPTSQAMIVPQLEAYTLLSGASLNEMAVDQRSKMPPALWWASYGYQSPELQKFAIKILSQPCSGAPRFKLKKDVSEQIHDKGRSCIEQQMFCNIEFVQNNLRLRDTPLYSDPRDCIGPEDSFLMDDWISKG